MYLFKTSKLEQDKVVGLKPGSASAGHPHARGTAVVLGGLLCQQPLIPQELPFALRKASYELVQVAIREYYQIVVLLRPDIIT